MLFRLFWCKLEKDAIAQTKFLHLEMENNMKLKQHVIDKVEPGSIAEELEIEAGDILLSINGKEIEDVFDYH